VWPATPLALSLSALEANVAAQLTPVRGIERSQLRADWHRYAVSGVDAGGRYPQLEGVGVGKRRWYATIFSFDRPRRPDQQLKRCMARAALTRIANKPTLSDGANHRA
jgi:hypothetical protein